MNNNFLTRKQSLELKQLGFDEPCFGYYINDRFEVFHSTRVSRRTNYEFSTDDNRILTAPLFQQAFRWFLSKYNLDGSLSVDVWNSKKVSWRITGGIKNIVSPSDDDNLYDWDKDKEFDTYKEAQIDLLNELIKIVKSKK